MPRKSTTRKKKPRTAKKEVNKLSGYADIPECQDREYAHKEYLNLPEKKIWDPNVNVEEWFPFYSYVARSVLTYRQEDLGIPNTEALENSCSGIADQYILDVLHESKYVPHDAVQRLFNNVMPQQLTEKWKPEEIKLFTSGILKHGKNFSIIRAQMLPYKPMEDFAKFYYVWKRSKMAETWRKKRMQIKKKQKKLERVDKQIRNLSNEKMLTRRAVAAMKRSLLNSEEINDSMPSTSTTPSEKDEQTSSTAKSTDSSKEHVGKPQNELPKTTTSVKSPKRNGQISANSTKSPKQSRKRKATNPVETVTSEQSAKRTKKTVPNTSKSKRQRRC